jgi:hypothetical protein
MPRKAALITAQRAENKESRDAPRRRGYRRDNSGPARIPDWHAALRPRASWLVLDLVSLGSLDDAAFDRRRGGVGDVPNCFVACVVQACAKSDGALASATSRAKSTAASAFACAMSMSLTFRSRTLSRADVTPSCTPRTVSEPAPSVLSKVSRAVCSSHSPYI